MVKLEFAPQLGREKAHESGANVGQSGERCQGLTAPVEFRGEFSINRRFNLEAMPHLRDEGRRGRFADIDFLRNGH